MKNREQEDHPTNNLPKKGEIQGFADMAVQTLSNLNFAARRAIVLQVIDKVIASREEIKLNGCIPINENVALCTTDRDSQDTIQLFEGGNSKSIPFEIKIEMPSPLNKRRNTDLTTLIIC